MSARLAIGVAMLAACVDPMAIENGPSDAGIAFTAPLVAHAPCIMQEGGLQALDCQAINIVESSIPMVAGGAVATANVQALGATPTQLVSATLTGMGYTFADVNCPGATTCTFANQPLPYMLGVQCATAGITGSLMVQGTNGMMDTDVAGLTCATPGPTISVTPSMIGPLSTPVGTPLTAPQTIQVTNNGTGTLSYSVMNTDPTQWQLMPINASCPTFPNCSLAGGGGMDLFEVTFDPAMHHDTPTVATFTFDGGTAGMPTVQATGSGTGAVLEVSPTSHDFLQLARGALGTREITITNTGNAPMNVSLTGALPPFGATQTSFTNIMPGGSRTFDATCQSATEVTPAASGTIIFMSDAYMPVGGMQTLSLQCEVLATDLQVTPNPVDFLEVKRGSPERTIDVMLFNASSVAETVTSVQLAGNPSSLSRSGFSSGQIPGGESRTVTLKLTTGSVVDLAQTKLEIQLQGQPSALAVPVQGKVVEASARVMPEMLDLGTACIGSRVSGIVTMINDGTATLMLDQPTMDQSFVAQSSSTFPLSLAANGQVGVEVTPAMMTVGNAKGVLSWPVHAFGQLLQTFSIPVDLTYIPTGTAVSPARLEFGQLDVALISPPSTVTLRNCDPDPINVRIEGLSAVKGALTAWQIEPAMGERTLASQETLTIAARFAPTKAGRHEANIVVLVNTEQKLVPLTGDALGPLLEKTSLYACDCSTSTPWDAWPVPLVLLVVLRRRRR